MFQDKRIHPALSLGVVMGISLLFYSCKTTNPNFEATDTNNNGEMEAAELEAAITKSMFKIADTNGDGSLSPEEVAKAAPDRPKAKFVENDKDKSGGISYEELVLVVDEEDTFDEFIKKMDVNNDGKISRTEAKEFHSAMSAAERDQNLTPLERLFDQ